MSWFRFRDVTPRGFYARSVLMVILPLILLLFGMTYVFFNSHIAQVSRKLSQNIAGDVAQVQAIITSETDTRPLDARISELQDTLRMDVIVTPDGNLPAERNSPFWTASRDAILDHELSVSLGETPYWFTTSADRSKVDIRIAPRNENSVIQVLVDRKRTFATMGHIFIVWVIVVSVIVCAIALAFLRNQVRSVLKLATAAEAWGRGEDIGVYRPSGATEVRQAARAIIQMRSRILAHADQRTAMLAGVSHDLRTPLTRLKLQLALLPPSDDLKAARKDLDEMSAMLDEYLAFARGEEGEAYEERDLAAITRETALNIQDRCDVSITATPDTMMRLRPLAIKRALANLINNAADHGRTVAITVTKGKRTADVIIEDDGPGIPEDQYEEAFKPFSRLDASRNQNKSGVGLGLALARDVARSHGGDVYLSKSGLGGLKAVLHLPLERRASL